MIRILPTTTASQKWVKHAQRYMAVLLSQFGHKRNHQRVKYFGDGVYGLFKINRNGHHKIILWGGGDSWHIVLTNYSTVHAYNYSNDVLIDTGLNITGADASYPILPMANGRSQIGDQYFVQLSGSWTAGLTGNDYQFLGALKDYEIGYFSDGETLYGRVDTEIEPLLSLTSTVLPELAAPYGGLFSVPVYRIEDSWNQFRGAIQYTLNPGSGSVSDSWYWMPSFFAAQPNDEYDLPPGFYYGHYPVATHGDGFTALSSAAVSLKAVMDTRYTSTRGAYNYGWAEILKSVDGEDVNTLYLYLQSGALGVPDNPTFGYYRIIGTVEDMTVWVGSDVKGFEYSTYMDISPTADVSLWNYEIYTSSALAQDTGVGVGIIDGTSATFYRYTGAMQTVCTTEFYHSHSISQDGRILAVFESADGTLISRVYVYDLYGNRPNLGTAVYDGGGYTDLRDSLEVTTALATSACVIPNRAEEFEPSTPILSLATEPSDYANYLPSLGHLTFFKRGTLPPTIKKVTCVNGVDAYYGISVDTCFDSTVIFEDPDLGVNEEKLVGWWDAGGIFKGVIRGNFTGSHPDMRFQGEGTPWIDPVTRPDTFTMNTTTSGTLIFGEYIGDLIPGNCMLETSAGIIIDPMCYATCEASSFDVTASTTCGMQAIPISVETSDPDPLVITGPSGKVNPDDWWVNQSSEPPSVLVGEYASASGGVMPYTWSGSGLTIDENTGEITAVGSDCTATITVTDDCGTETSVSVATNSGTWTLVDSTLYCYGGSCATGSCSGIAVSAGCDDCSVDPDNWQYVPVGYPSFVYLPVSETPFGTNWTCGGLGCYLNLVGGANWTTDRAQTSKTVLVVGAQNCSDFTTFLRQYVYHYVWSCP